MASSTKLEQVFEQYLSENRGSLTTFLRNVALADVIRARLEAVDHQTDVSRWFLELLWVIVDGYGKYKASMGQLVTHVRHDAHRLIEQLNEHDYLALPKYSYTPTSVPQEQKINPSLAKLLRDLQSSLASTVHSSIPQDQQDDHLMLTRRCAKALMVKYFRAQMEVDYPSPVPLTPHTNPRVTGDSEPSQSECLNAIHTEEGSHDNDDLKLEGKLSAGEILEVFQRDFNELKYHFESIRVLLGSPANDSGPRILDILENQIFPMWQLVLLKYYGVGQVIMAHLPSIKVDIATVMPHTIKCLSCSKESMIHSKQENVEVSHRPSLSKKTSVKRKKDDTKANSRPQNRIGKNGGQLNLTSSDQNGCCCPFELWRHLSAIFASHVLQCFGSSRDLLQRFVACVDDCHTHSASKVDQLAESLTRINEVVLFSLHVPFYEMTLLRQWHGYLSKDNDKADGDGSVQVPPILFQMEDPENIETLIKTTRERCDSNTMLQNVYHDHPRVIPGPEGPQGVLSYWRMWSYLRSNLDWTSTREHHSSLSSLFEASIASRKQESSAFQGDGKLREVTNFVPGRMTWSNGSLDAGPISSTHTNPTKDNDLTKQSIDYCEDDEIARRRSTVMFQGTEYRSSQDLLFMNPELTRLYLEYAGCADLDVNSTPPDVLLRILTSLSSAKD